MPEAGKSPSTANLFSLDPATGVVLATLGATQHFFTGLAFHPLTGELFGVTSFRAPTPNALYKIDPLTVSVTLVGSLGFGIKDLSFDTNGTLYGWGSIDGGSDLYVINTQTGAATKVGEAGDPLVAPHSLSI